MVPRTVQRQFGSLAARSRKPEVQVGRIAAGREVIRDDDSITDVGRGIGPLKKHGYRCAQRVFGFALARGVLDGLRILDAFAVLLIEVLHADLEALVPLGLGAVARGWAEGCKVAVQGDHVVLRRGADIDVMARADCANVFAVSGNNDFRAVFHGRLGFKIKIQNRKRDRDTAYFSASKALAPDVEQVRSQSEVVIHIRGGRADHVHRGAACGDLGPFGRIREVFRRQINRQPSKFCLITLAANFNEVTGPDIDDTTGDNGATGFNGATGNGELGASNGGGRRHIGPLALIAKVFASKRNPGPGIHSRIAIAINRNGVTSHKVDAAGVAGRAVFLDNVRVNLVRRRIG